MPSLTRTEARTRAALVRPDAVEVDLDLDRGPEEFASRTVLRFTCHEPGATTFVDLAPVTLHRVVLNGRELDPADLADERFPLADLAAENVLEVEATMGYSRDGQGLHRATDPADDEDYVYGHLFLDAAPRVFACFDQPDLKAPYTVTVATPDHWSVVGNGAAEQVGPGRWALATTAPLATYFVTVCAGPWVSVRGEHEGTPLGLHARRSLEQPLREHAPRLLEVTSRAFDAYEELFGIDYPFGEYHQVFVPEFNAGAMENPGCVTIRDQYLFRGAATPDQLLEVANTVVHELAHMWFGDLVTMRWWDDLWLNESFAEYMAYRTSAGALGSPEAWVEFGIVRKRWGYAADRAPSTHPVAGSPAPDARSALQNFDGISYAKGASVLRQLIAHIGDEAFVAGVRDHLAAHAYGNADLAEFLDAMARAAGTSLEGWAQGWLRTAGADRVELDRAGRLTRSTPSEHPADRPHTLDVAAFEDGREVLREQVVLQAEALVVPGVADLGAAAILVPNAADLTWAEVVLDEASQEALVTGLAEVGDPVARQVLWTSLLTGMHRGDVDPRRVVEVFDHAWAREDDPSVLRRVAHALTATVVPTFLPAQEADAALRRVAQAADVLLTRAGETGGVAGDGLAVVAARVLAASSTDVDRLLTWADGSGLPDPLEGDEDFRWLVLRRLSALDALPEDRLTAAETADRSMAGRLAALGVRTVAPTEEAKRAAWERLRDDERLSNYEALEIARAFWAAPDPDLVRPYVTQVGDLLAGLSHRMGEDALSRIATAMAPLSVVEEATGEASAAMLAREDLPPGVHRALLDEDHVLREALESRRRFG